MYDGSQRPFLLIGVFVGDYRVQFPVTQRRLVYTHLGAEVLRKNQPFRGVGGIFPVGEPVQMLLILVLELVTLDVIVLLKRRSRYRVFVQVPLLKSGKLNRVPC